MTVAPIDTSGSFFPNDLTGQNIDSAVVIARFNAFMDWVLSRLSTVSLISIQIGNEIDAPSSASSQIYWSRYKNFLTAIVSHLHSSHPGVKIGVTTTLYGLIGTGGKGSVAQNGILALLPVVDNLGLTYYPLNSDFTVKLPSVVGSELNSAFALVGATPVFLQEAGYPTSIDNNSSVDLQAQFIDALFSAWDQHASSMPFLSMLRMNDLSASAAQSTASQYGLGSNTAFVGYLQTLGFRTYPTPSSAKSAWGHLQLRTRERGWP